MCRSGTAARLLASVESHHGELPQAVRDARLAEVRAFRGAAQSEDVTIVVVRYNG